MGHLMTHKMRHNGIDVVQNPLLRPQSKEDEMGTGGSVRQIDDTFSSPRMDQRGNIGLLMTLKMANDVHWFKALHSKFSN